MYFNSSAFIAFLATFLLLYFLLRDSLMNRNRLIVAASYFFYAWWDWRFTGLLLLSSVVDYYVGLSMEHAGSRKRRKLLILSLSVNLGVLAFFKYCNFFIENLDQLGSFFGLALNPRMLSVILPVGISFYTFQSLSYTIDVYRKQITPTRDLTAFLAYVSFFPQLVAGPIERASSLLPQFLTTRKVTAKSIEVGTWLILWGLFKKVVVADNLAPLVDMVYSDPSIQGPIIALGTLAFGFQIYCDFSGYSDVARGIASILGFQLILNFNLPYFARTPSDFWRRWHISLSSWFRDYVYIPLGGNRGGRYRTQINLLLTMVLAGLWHGAGWNFILWGLWHGLLLTLFGKFQPRSGLQSTLSWGVTMIGVFYGWLLFRSQSFDQITSYTSNVWNPVFPNWSASFVVCGLLFCSPILLMQVWQSRSKDLMPSLKLPLLLKTALHSLLLYAIILFWDTRGTPFIYFQF
jgi:D-alanyl-lipoteichoic acid acyltransferase DltB (MBOAT superfamily)